MSSIDAQNTENRETLLHTVASAIVLKCGISGLLYASNLSLSPSAMCGKVHVCTHMNYVAGFSIVTSRLEHVKKIAPFFISISLDLPHPRFSNQSQKFTGGPLLFTYLSKQPPSICTRDCREIQLRPRAKATSGL